ncbi:MAG TPA: ABC transporter permease [Bryobacteraceae bacterium]|nr:ABC transporter permease [Bryobacteraceae bacterium]
MSAIDLDEVLRATAEHLGLTIVALTAAFVIAMSMAVLLAWHERQRRAVVAVINVLQTIPSLALFGFLIPIPLIGGIGKRTAIVALSLYAMLPILRNALTGILGIDAAVRESAVALGMDRWQVLRQVELPLATPTIVAGLRVATVATIGTATVAAAIGGGGLGTFVFRGIAMAHAPTVLAGAVPAALMAIAADEVLGWIERRLAR